MFSSGELNSLPEGLLEKFIARRLRKEDGAYCLNYNSAMVRPSHNPKAREIDLQASLRQQKLNSL